jgi:hypothetical protein
MRRTLAALMFSSLVCDSLGAQARWTVDAKPMIDMKGADETGTLIFGGVTWATRLRNGTIVVADGTGPALHFISAQGRLIKSTGKSGQGPGDFRTVSWVGQCGEGGIHAWDFPQRRMSLFDEAGSFKSVFAFAGAEVQTSTTCTESGTLLTLARSRVLPPSAPPDPDAGYGLRQVAATPTIVSSKGDTLAKLPETVIVEVIASQGGGGPRPLGTTLLYAFSRDRLWLGMPDSALVVAYSLDGKRVGAIPVRQPPRPVAKPNYDKAVEYYLTIVPPAARTRFKSIMMQVPPPVVMPPFTGLYADPDGLIWVNLSAPGDPDTQLRAFAADGRVVASVTIPMWLNIYEIGRDYVLGARTDTDDEPHLIVFRLNRSGRP